MEPKSFKNPLKIDPTIDVEKWTVKILQKSTLGGPKADPRPKSGARVVSMDEGQDPREGVG